MLRFRSIAMFALVLVLGSTVGFQAASAQRLSVPAGGEKLVTLTDKVNKNQFIWVSDAPLESIKGTSEGVGGTLTMDPQDLSTIRGTVTTQVSTMRTGNETRDHHLVSAEWLDASRYPLITFTITSVDNIKTNGTTATGYATGNFTLHGVTKRITIPFSLSYVPENAQTRQRAPGDLVMFSADFTIALKDFNVTGTDGVVGSKVGDQIKITAHLFGNAVPRSTT